MSDWHYHHGSPLMLRIFFLLLVLANGSYFAWSQGLLSTLGIAPSQQVESQRMTQQIRPQELRLLSAQELAQARLEGAPTRPASGPSGGR